MKAFIVLPDPGTSDNCGVGYESHTLHGVKM